MGAPLHIKMGGRVRESEAGEEELRDEAGRHKKLRDISFSLTTFKEKRQVNVKGLESATKCEVPYFETSAVTGKNVDRVFEILIHARLAQKR
jgi:hypothetical protein